MDHVSTWDESYDVGRRGEKAIIRYLRTRQDTFEVYDASRAMQLQKAGIDIIWKQKNSIGGFRDMTVEVKTTRSARYFYIETIKDIYTGVPGWLYTSGAHYIFFVSLPNDTLYIIPLYALKSWFEIHGSSYEAREWGRENYQGTIIVKKSKRVPIPIYQLMQDIPAIEAIPKLSRHMYTVDRIITHITPSYNGKRFIYWAILILIGAISVLYFARLAANL